MELELKHLSGNISKLNPVSFKYRIVHRGKPSFYDNGEFAGYEVSYYEETPIDQLWDVTRSSTMADIVEITEIFGEELPNEQYTDINNIFALLSNSELAPRKCDVVSEGKLIFINRPTEINTLFGKEIVKDLTFSLYSCIPTTKADNKFGITFDFIKAHVTGSGK